MLELNGGTHGAHLRADVVDQIGAYGLRSAVATGVLRALWPRVVVEAPRWADPWTRAAAAMLAFGPDVALTGPTAAHLHGCDAAASGRELYRLDLAWPDLRIVLEYDGYAVHEERTAEDEARTADLERRGWIVVRATARDLRDPTDLVQRLRQAFRERGYVW